MADWWDDPAFDSASQRSPWDRFKDAYLGGSLHSPFGAEGVARLYLKHVKGYSDEQINQAERNLSEQLARKQEADPVFNGGSLQQGAVRGAIDVLGNIAGGADPSYALAPGATALERIGAQSGINAGMDALSQGVEIHRGVRDKYDPVETGISAAAGAGFQSVAELAHALRARGLDPDKAQGIAAGIWAESRGKANAVNQKYGAFGLGQWLGSRKAELFKRYGNNPTPDDQLDFLVHELHGGDAGGPKVLAQKGSDNVLRSYIQDFMRPAKGKETVGDLTRGSHALDEIGAPSFDPEAHAVAQEPGFTAPELPDAFDQKFTNDSLEPKPWDDLPTLTEFAKENPQLLRLGDKTSTVDLEQKPFHHDEENIVYDDYPEHTEDLHVDNGIQPHYDYIGVHDPFQEHYEKTGNSVPGLTQDAIHNTAELLGVHPFDVAEAYFNKDASFGLNPEAITKKVNDEVKLLTNMGANDGPVAGKALSYAPYEYGKEHYVNLKEYEKEKGPVGPLTKQALKEYAADNGIDNSYVESHYFSETGDPTIKEGVTLWRDNLAKEKMTPKEYAAYQKLPTNDPKVLKILKKHLVGVPKETRPPSVVAKAAHTFLNMLKDERGGALQPDDIHAAVTEWNKGTNYLLKGPDGTPLRIYHGTRNFYEGMPKGEFNHQPPGFVLYSTDPEFANGYTGSDDSNAGRIFPAYLSKEAKLGDFRNPRDVERVYQWYQKNRSGDDRPSLGRIKAGSWGLWENDKMYHDLGWDGSYMTEAYIDGNPHVNLAVKDEFVRSVFDPETYKNNTLGHRIVNTIVAMLKDDSGSLKGDEPKGPDKGYEGLDPEDKLLKALNAMRPLTAKQRDLLAEKRSANAGKLADIQKEGGGLKSYEEQGKALSNKAKKVQFDSIAHNFTEEDINKLLDRINFSNSMRPHEKFAAQTALLKLLGADGARIPTPYQIKLLSNIFKPEVISALLHNRPFVEKFWKAIDNALNLPRAFMSSYDVSAPLRQGVLMIGRKEFWTAWASMYKYFGSERASKALYENIRSRPTYQLMRDAKLAVDNDGHFLTDREEAFRSNWAEKVPIIGLGVRASERAYNGFLAKLRADTFDSMVKKYEAMGVNLASEPDKVKSLGRMINTLTGRGQFPRKLETAVPLMNSVLFAPKLLKSRVDLVNPFFYGEMDHLQRMETMKTLLGFGAVALTTIGLGKAAGFDINMDPTSSDFLKLKHGNNRMDVWGGLQQYVVFASRLALAKEAMANGGYQDLRSGAFGKDTQKDLIEKFTRSKLAPIPSIIMDYFSGDNKESGKPFKDVVGQRHSIPSELAKHVLPMAVQDISDIIADEHNINNVNDVYSAIHDNGAKAIGYGIPAAHGVGIQTYAPKQSTPAKGQNWWDDPAFGGTSTPVSSRQDWWNDPSFSSGVK